MSSVQAGMYVGVEITYNSQVNGVTFQDGEYKYEVPVKSEKVRGYCVKGSLANVHINKAGQIDFVRVVKPGFSVKEAREIVETMKGLRPVQEVDVEIFTTLKDVVQQHPDNSELASLAEMAQDMLDKYVYEQGS